MAGGQIMQHGWAQMPGGALAAALGLLVIASPGQAAVTSNWQNATGLNNDFGTPTSNWDNNHVPVDGDTAAFGLSGQYTVAFSVDEKTSALQVTSGNVTFDLGGHKYTQTATYKETTPVVAIVVGDTSGSNASLTLVNGTLDGGSTSTGRRIIGNAANSTGKLTVSTGAILATDRWTYVGNSGTGTLEIKNGGQVYSTYSTIGAATGGIGYVTIDGGTSIWQSSSDTQIANAAANTQATIMVSGGGTFYTGSTSVSNNKAGTQAAITVTGTGSKWQAGTTGFGGAGPATLNILNGGAVNANGDRTFTVNANGIVNLKGSGTFDFGTGGSHHDISFTGGTLNVTGLSNTLKGAAATFDAAAHFTITLAAGQANSSNAHLDLGNTPLTLGANGIDVLLDTGFMPQAGDSFKLLSWDTPATWTLDTSSVHLPGLTGGMQWDTTNLAGNGIISIAVPEPTMATLIGLGLIGGMLRRRRTTL